MSVFGRALSASEIQSLYNAGSAGKCTSTPSPSYHPSTTDLWDISQGTIITTNSPLYPGGDARDIFGGTFGSPEVGKVLFSDSNPGGFTNFVEWKTVAPVTVGSCALFAYGDGPALANEREFSRLVLKAKSSAAATNFDLTLYSATEPHPYVFVDATNFALIVTNIAPVTAQYFRAEFVQYAAGRGFDGSRVMELDGFATNSLAPTLLVQPTNQTAFVGDTVMFSALAQGAQPLSYQWLFGPNSLPGATNISLTLTNVQLTNAGTYSLSISNTYGSTNSSNATLTVTAPVCDPPPTNLVGWFAGEGNALDNIGGNIGSPIGSLAYVPGKVGQAFSFDGSTAGVSFPASSNLNVGAGSGLTIECWIKPNNLSTREALVEWNNGAASGVTWGVHFWMSETFGGSGPGCLYGNVVDSGATHLINTAPGVLQLNVFQHVAFTYDKASGNAVLYLNGAVVASQSLGTLNPLTTYGLYLGERPSEGAASRFNGVMDEVGIYNRALAGAEIQAIYAAQSLGKCPAPPQVTVQPQGQAVPTGTTVTLAPQVTGAQPITYQWQQNGVNLPGATNTTLTLMNVQLTNGGTYLLAVTNSVNYAISSNAVLTVTTPICFGSPSNLVGWWAGEGNALDNNGVNNGVLLNNVNFAPGRVGQAFNFNGTNTYAFIPRSSSLNVGQGGGFTVEAWFNTRGSAAVPIVEWNPNNGSYGVHFHVNQTSEGSLYANIVDTSGNYHFIQSASGLFSTNAIQHGALTYDKTSGIGRLYLNGAIVQETSLGSFVPQTTYDFYIGYRTPPTPFGPLDFNGLLDEVSLYSRALAPSEIQAVYAAQGSGKCPTAPSIFAQPQSQTVTATSNVTFTAGISGSQPVSYQWLSNSIPLAGATNVSLTLSNVQPSFVANYSLAATNAANFTVSSNATLKVTTIFVYGNSQLLTNSQYNFAGSVTLQLSNIYSSGLVFYTLDGSAPSFASTLYSSPFVVTQSCTLRVLAYSTDFSQAGLSDPLTLNFPPVYTLSATTAGGGTIALSPAGGAYLSNTVVGISATASNGWGFLQWTGDAGGTNRTNSVLMNGNRSVQALFGTALSTSASGGGSVMRNPSGLIFPFGTHIELTAVPQAGNYFAIWGSAAGASSISPLDFVITNANPMVSSLFVALPGGQAALTVIPVGHGQVMINPQANAYSLGQMVTVTATADTNQVFLGWSGDATGTQNPLTVTMDQSRVIYANFSKNYSLSLQPTSGGFMLSLTGEVATAYEFDRSTNLPAWTPLSTLTNFTGTLQYMDSGATNQNTLFYRGLPLP